MADQDHPIHFYGTNSEYGCFSNFSRHTVFLKDKKWQTSEHYFQAQKFAGTHYEEQVRATASPGKAASLGRSRALPLRKDWEKVKDGIMKDVLIAKFTQHKDIQQTLLDTKNRTIVEHTDRDSYWGDGGGDGCGKNMLGYLLMQVRDEMLKSSTKVPATEKEETIKSESTDEGEEEEDSVEEDGEGGEGHREGGEGDGGEQSIEPNVNYMYTPGASAEKKTNGLKKKMRRGGSTKTKSKRGVFKDADGSSTLEKTTEKKGSVTVIGEGTVFSEKALPPQAKFVVNKHQMQRKYHPTEKDFAEHDKEEDENGSPAAEQRKKKPVMADFFKLRETPKPNSIETASEETMTAEECIEAAKNNSELLEQISENDDLRGELVENSRKIRDALRRYIEQFADAGDARLEAAMQSFEKLENSIVS